MNLKIEILSNQQSNINELIHDNIISIEKELADYGAKIDIVPERLHKAFGAPEILVFFLQFGGSVSANLIASWLYDNFSKKNVSIKINGDVISIENLQEIEKLIVKVVENESSGVKETVIVKK